MKRKIRYAVVGLGHIAEIAVLPAFKHAKENSELVALISGNDKKLKRFGKKYGVDRLYKYSEFGKCLETAEIDVVYLCTPNTHHHNFTKVAAHHGVHVLCEKPMATEEAHCLEMINAAKRNNVKLMIAYRLHFEPANLYALELAQKKKLGDLKVFNSTFTMQVEDPDDIRLKSNLGGGPLFGIGIYCINAARMLFQDEPIEVMARSSRTGDPRFKEVEEVTSAILTFPGGRQASFTASFGATDTADYVLIGTKGLLCLENAYEHSEKRYLEVKTGNKTKSKIYRKRDQFAPELIYFSDCILQNREPEPSGWEGLADVRIIKALLESARTGTAVSLKSSEEITREAA